MENFHEAVPRELAGVIQNGMKHGLTEEQIVKGMVSLGNFAQRVTTPDTPEEALIKAMWNEATDDEKNMISRIILRVGKKDPH